MSRATDNEHAFWLCPACGGGCTTASVLRSRTRPDIVDSLWKSAEGPNVKLGPQCPACTRAMSRVALSAVPRRFDLCKLCTLIWFDPGEVSQLPEPDPRVRRRADYGAELKRSTQRRIRALRRPWPPFGPYQDNALLAWGYLLNDLLLTWGEHKLV